MLIEKFIIYKYDNVFYTKEELEKMGFVYMRNKEDYVRLKENCAYYEITKKWKLCESLYSIQDYLGFNEERLIGQFLYDFGDHGLILGVDKYYGIKYKDKNKTEIVQLFNDEQACFDAYLLLDTEIKKIFEEFSHCTTDMYKSQGDEILKYAQEKETRQKLLSLISKKEK